VLSFPPSLLLSFSFFLTLTLACCLSLRSSRPSACPPCLPLAFFFCVLHPPFLACARTHWRACAACRVVNNTANIFDVIYHELDHLNITSSILTHSATHTATHCNTHCNTLQQSSMSRALSSESHGLHHLTTTNSKIKISPTLSSKYGRQRSQQYSVLHVDGT